MLKLKQITDFIEGYAPLLLQMPHDNCGLILGRADADVDKVLLTLDVTEEVVQEANLLGAQLIVAHHPPIFAPLKRFEELDSAGRAVLLAAKFDIAIYAAHTNVDYTNGGLNDYVAKLLGLCDIKTVSGQPSDPRIGNLTTATTLQQYALSVSRILGDSGVRVIGDPKKPVLRVALINGGGGGDVEPIKKAFLDGADVFLTADVKYHIARFTKDNNYAMITYGHYDSERCFSDLMQQVLADINVKTYKSQKCHNPYNEKGVL